MSKDKEKPSPELLALIKAVKSKRARQVAEHILKHGFITTDDIRKGFGDPYRPTQDLRDEGVPLESYKVKNEKNRTISAYKFGSASSGRADRAGGRKAFSKKFKDALIALYGSHCAICLAKLKPRYLQIDHRVPYQIAGDAAERRPEDFMLLCGSDNRSKSWSCENCENFTRIKIPENCKTCYWASPNSYAHIALVKIRRMKITWMDNEVKLYDKIKKEAAAKGQEVADYVKDLLNHRARR